MSSTELSPGIIIDTENGEAYVMSPGGGILAVELREGTQMWHSRDADKPLAMSGDLLVSQAESGGPDNELKIVSLQTKAKGKQVSESLVPLPAGVQPMIDRAPNRSFTATARPLDDDTAISWEFTETPIRGMDMEQVEILPDEEEAIAESGELSPPIPSGLDLKSPGPAAREATLLRGTVRLSAAKGTYTPMVEAHSPPAIGPAIPESLEPPPAPDDNFLPDVPQPQFLSSDGQHVLSSSRVADDTEWEQYRWEIFDRDSGNSMGEFRTHSAYAPFVVSGNSVVVESQPYVRLIGDEVIDEPLQIQSIDLESGKPVWKQAVRDTVDTTPPPP